MTRNDELDDALLRDTARQLGARAAARLDLERTTAAVLAELRERPAAPRGTFVWAQPTWLRIAAAIVLVVGGALATRAAIMRQGPRHAGHYVVEDLSDLSAAQLQQILAVLDETLDLGAPADSEPSLEQLTEEQLRVMLRSLEG